VRRDDSFDDNADDSCTKDYANYSALAVLYGLLTLGAWS
jgi:hypothetical protein